MACFIVPGTEAVVSTIVTKAIEKQEMENTKTSNTEIKEHTAKSIIHKMKWLNTMLWGGSALLAFEHVWHGEVVPFFPFLTAASNSHDAVEMLYEMGTTGVAMAVTVTVVWAGMAAVSHMLEKRSLVEEREKAAERVR